MFLRAVSIARVLVCLGAVALFAPPVAAKSTFLTAMEVQIVRSAEPGCEPECPEWISAQGRIDASTVRLFKRVLAQVGDRKLPILIDSAGGAVNESLEIGRLIRARQLSVAVTRTEFVECPPQDLACRKLKAKGVRLGTAHAMLSKCASSCAFILAGGVRRYVGPGTVVGVHQISTFQVFTQVLRTFRVETKTQFGVPVSREKKLLAEKKLGTTTVARDTPMSTYENVGKYFVEMGVSEGILSLILRTPSDRIHWLTLAELTRLNMATDFTSGQRLVHPAKVDVVLPGPAPAIPDDAFKQMAKQPTHIDPALIVSKPEEMARPAVAAVPAEPVEDKIETTLVPAPVTVAPPKPAATPVRPQPRPPVRAAKAPPGEKPAYEFSTR
jgi:hypothetical protein